MGGERGNNRHGARRWSDGWRRLTRIWQSDTSANVDEELRFHFEHKVAEFIATGASPSEARARAEAEFGDVESVRDSLRAIDGRVEQRQRRAEWWEGALQDLKYVMRSLRRSPAFTITVVVTLALGLGANAALFSLLNSVFVQSPAGINNPDALRRVYFRSMNRGEPSVREVFDYPQFRSMVEVAPDGMQLAGYTYSQRSIGDGELDAKVSTNFVVGDYFGVLGVRPLIGRLFAPEEYAIAGYAPVAVISEELWNRKYRRDPEIVGKTINLGAHHHQIIGVVANGFRGADLNVTDLWAPRNTQGVLRNRKPDWYDTNRGTLSTRVIFRVSNEGAVKVFNARAGAALLKDKFTRDTLASVFTGSIVESRNGQQRTSQRAISTRLGGVAVVILLIACANVINLLLARSSARRREIAVRLALGISRSRLIAQLVLESAVLSIFAGVVSLAIGYFGTETLRKLLLPDVQLADGAMNPAVIVFVAVTALLTGFVAGIVPALQSSQPNLTSSLKSSVRDGGNRRAPLGTWLLIAQAAMSIVLLAGAGVFVKSMQQVQGISVGFDRDRLVFATSDYDHELEDHYAEISARLPEMVDEVRRLPGVESVALSSSVPMYSISFSGLFLPDRDSLPSAGTSSRLESVVSPEFFATVGMRVLRGKLFTDADRFGTEPVILINEAMAQNLWPGGDALTKCIIVGKRTEPCRRVLGIVSHAHYSTNVVENDVAMQYYLPLAQMTNTDPAGVVVIRTAAGSTHAVAALVSKRISAHLGSWSQPSTIILDDLLAPSLRSWRIGAALFSAAGILALVVAAVGVYSSMAYTVSQRSQEMGVRVALGATSRNIVRLVVGEGLRAISVGVAIGVVVTLALASLVASLLYNTSPRDPLVIAASSATLVVVSAIACAIPAWRASRVDPLAAMRAE